MLICLSDHVWDRHLGYQTLLYFLFTFLQTAVRKVSVLDICRNEIKKSSSNVGDKESLQGSCPSKQVGGITSSLEDTNEESKLFYVPISHYAL